MRELAHRGKSLISVIQAIALRTLTGERTLKDAREALVGRLRALANTYNTLTEDAPEVAQLHSIVASELETFSE
jgi:two-component sensor histidine kinase